MNWRSPRILLPILIVLIMLTVGISLAVLYIRSRSDITIVWQASTTLFTQQDQQSIQTALQSALLASNSDSLTGHEFTIIDAQRQGDWADFSLNERVSPKTQPIATEPLFFLTHLQGATWSGWLPGSPGFCNELKQTPDTLLDSIDKHYFLGCYH